MKNNNQKYAVIGGQYYYCCYGFARTLEGAKRLSSANLQYFDNWQGWHYPSIYKAEDVETVTTDYGDVYVPIAPPVATRPYGRKWAVDEAAV